MCLCGNEVNIFILKASVEQCHISVPKECLNTKYSCVHIHVFFPFCLYYYSNQSLYLQIAGYRMGGRE